MNVFEHQSFLLRKPPSPKHPLGEQIRRSYREIMTGGDESLRFDYPLEYFNVAALGLCIALTQALLEPENLSELFKRLNTPVDETEFEEAIAGLRDTFSIDGAVRFMQGPEPQRDKKGRLGGEDLSALILSIKKGDKEFLNRPSDGAVVALDQIPLLLFSRSTYFEKSAGRGYLTGTSGDLEIRTYLIDRTSLRRTIWLNVLAQDQQGEHFSPIDGSAGYDKWMWESPPAGDVAQGNVSLRSGLLWMVANGYIEIEEIATPRQCLVTGEMVEGRAGTGVIVSPTGKGYGVKVAREKGPEVRMSFFRHPNGPSQTIEPPKGTPFTRHLSVRENSGLVGEMGGLFFSSAEFGGKGYHMAPVIKQLYELRGAFKKQLRTTRLQLLCFGFHMLSSKQNVHGGYESEMFEYPLLGERDSDGLRALKNAEELMQFAAERTGKIEWPLKRAIQLCTLTQIDTEISEKEDGRLEFKEKSKIDSGGMMSDSAMELWRHAGIELRELIAKIAAHGNSADDLSDAIPEIRLWWTRRIAEHATTIFYRIFNDYSMSPTHMIAAFNAKRLFHGSLWKIDSGIYSADATQTPQPEEAAS